MTRFAPIVLAGLLLTVHSTPAQDKEKAPEEINIPGQLLEIDPPDKVRKQPSKVHVVKLQKDQAYIIDLLSKDFDAYLRIEDVKGATVAQDDDGGDGSNARIRFVAPASDAFLFAVTSFGGGSGNYHLRIKPIVINPALVKKVELKDGALRVDGNLVATDPVDLVRQNSHCQVFTVKFAKGKTYTIDLTSNAFDSYLRLETAKGAQLKEDDDSGGNLNARIQHQATEDGEYRIVATTLGGNMVGAFTLMVKEN